MGLFLPTSGSAQVPVSSSAVRKGQLYNLDLDEKISFQFNPQPISWRRRTSYAEFYSHGETSGGDIEFLFTGPRQLELDLIFTDEPGAPALDYYVQPPREGNSAEFGADFEFVVRLFERWMEPSAESGNRIPLLRLILAASTNITGIITAVEPQIVNQFEDGSVREGRITLEFRQWNRDREV